MFRHISLVLFILCTALFGYSQSTQPILKLNTEIHSARINRLDTDASGRYILTCSWDKTAKLWEANSGQLIRTFRPPIGEGNDGMLFACAISPDAKWVLVAGWTEETRHDIYIFETSTGLLYHRIAGLPNKIDDLEFSPDGNFFAIGLGGSDGMRVYRTATFNLYAADSDYGGDVYNVCFANNGNLATVSFDGLVRLYDPYFNLIKKVRPVGGKRLFSLAFSPDSRKLAIGFNDSPRLQVLDGNTLELLYEPDKAKATSSDDKFNKVVFSKDGTQLIAGGTYSLYQNGAWWSQIRVWENAGKGYFQDFRAADDTVMDIKILPNGQIAFGGAKPDWGIIDQSRGNQKLYKTAEANNYTSTNTSHFRLSPDGYSLGVTVWQKAPLCFSLNEKEIRVRASTHASYKDKVNGISVTNWFDSTSPKLNGKNLSFLESYEPCYSVDISEKSNQMVFGAAWHIYCLDQDGTKRWETNTQSITWAVKISGDGRVATGAFGDGTIRWYRMSDGKLLLTLFMHPDNKRWILWTPSGYYDAAPGAEDLLGWHVNQGADKEALFYPVSRFRYDYYRPDVIDRILETLDEVEALTQANTFANRRTSARRDITKELPPSVKILSPMSGSPVFANVVNLEYNITSPNNEPVTDLKVLIDGRPSPENRGIRPSGTRGKIAVSVPNRNCRVSLLAKNRFGSSETATIDLQWKGQLELDLYKPNLYILAIGVSDYKDSKYDLTYAAKDATDFVATMKKQEGKLYKKVIPKLLTDDAANRIDILKGLEWLNRETTQHDVAMLFFAGHGMENSQGTFYFLPVEATQETLRFNGVMKEDIKETVKTIPGKVLVFMDACHSGYLMTTTSRKRGGPNMTRIINELRDAENGAVVFSSSTGQQYSLEDARWNNGAFTKALVEGMNGAADLFGDGKITCKSLDNYITNRVKELTNGEQSPTTNFPPNVEDFPIGVKY